MRFCGSVVKRDLQVQTYGGVEEYRKHFFDELSTLKDKRYIRIDGKPAFMIYKPPNVPDLKVFIGTWNSLAKENGFEGIFFIGQSARADYEKEKILESGILAVNPVRLFDSHYYKNSLYKGIYKIIRIVLRIPMIKDLSSVF